MIRTKTAFSIVLLAFSASARADDDSPESALPRMETVRRPPAGRTVRETPLPKQQMWDTTEFPARMIYLNGVNVSSIRNQDLENVRLRIDEAGNLHITAPHYDVSVDASYHALLPGELPRFPKGTAVPEGLPTGKYSKSTGERSTLVPPPDEIGTGESSGDESATPPLPSKKAAPAGKATPRKESPKSLEPVEPQESTPLRPEGLPGNSGHNSQPARNNGPSATTIPAPELPGDMQGGANL